MNMNSMYNVTFSSKFRIISKEKGTMNRKIYAEYGEGVSNKTSVPFSYLKMDKFRLYKKDISNLSMIQKEIYTDLFIREDSSIKNYLYSDKKNILSLRTCKISKEII